MAPTSFDHFKLNLTALADDLTRKSHNKRARRDDLSFPNQSPRRDDRAGADDGSVEDRRSHADQAIRFDRRTVNDGPVSDRDPLADEQRISPIEIASASPRITEPKRTVHERPIVTFPRTVALGAM